MHYLQDPLTCIPVRDQLHAEYLRHADTLRAMADGCLEGGLTAEDFAVSPVAWDDAANLFTEYWPSIYSAPLFSPEFCAKLVRESDAMSFSPNEQEEEAYQIPEVVLQHECIQLHGSLSVHFHRVCKDWAALLFGMEITVLRTIQFAKYTPDTVDRGNFHIDCASDFTVVVALSDEHKGGGTEVLTHGFGRVITVPQLPIGHAMIFPGKVFRHRGLPVTSGCRNLLVFWSEIQ